ncbi:MAG: hypothetical protein H7259_01325 [Cytophagales bacterium]|nr:hypothetical protein [Cytophaga sp.]
MNTLTEKLLELAEEEAGIKLQAKDITLTVEDSDLIIGIWGEELIATEYIDEEDFNDEDFAEEITEAIKEEYYDFRERLIEMKLASLNLNYIEVLKGKIIPILESAKVEKRLLEMLDFEFIDVSSADKDIGLPTVALRITDFEKVECNCTIDVSKNPAVFDEKKLANDFLKKYR